PITGQDMLETSANARPGSGAPNLAAQPSVALGQINSISGSQAIAALQLNGPDRASLTVGRFVKIETGKSLIVGVITDISSDPGAIGGERRGSATARIDLMGQIDQTTSGPCFKRGVADYPTIGDAVVPLTHDELGVVFQGSEQNSIKVGFI